MKASLRVWAGAAVVAGVAAIGVALVFSQRDSGPSPCEKVVEFTYSRTQPCNAEYYNYGFSVGPLMDLIRNWKRDQSAFRYDFRANLKAWIRAHSKDKTVSLSEEEIDGLCRKVEIAQSPKNKFGHPILCTVKFSCDNSVVMELLTAAYKECMLASVERENIMAAEKATMKEIGAFQRQEREVLELKNKLSATGLSASEVEQLKRTIADAERAAINSKAECQAAKNAFRKKWDASIVFLDDPNSAK